MKDLSKLVKKAKKGNKESFCELITIVKKELYLIARTRLKNEDDIADVIQDTIETCYKNIRSLKKDEAFRAWIIKILINCCNKIYKIKGKNDISIEEEQIKNNLRSNDSIEEKIAFETIIRNLTNEEKTIMTLYYYYNYTTKEISKILKIKEGTIKSKISRAKEKLRNEYKGVEI